MFTVKLNYNNNLSDFTLVIPAVSVGNVGQLAVDLIINTIGAIKLGYVHTPYLYPLVGCEAFGGGRDSSRGQLCTGCEVFISEEHKLALIQQRSPIIKGKSGAFLSELRNWIKEKRFRNVILLTSSFSHHRLDSQINDPVCRFLCTATVDSTLPSMFQSKLNWKSLECNDTLVGNPYEDKIAIPGGGIAAQFYHEWFQQVASQKYEHIGHHAMLGDIFFISQKLRRGGRGLEDGIPLIILLKFCSEGDNIPDSMELVTVLNSWLQLVPEANQACQSNISPPANLVPSWRIPASWQLLFGGGPPSSIY